MRITVFDSVSDHYGSSRICRLIIQIIREAGHELDAYVSDEKLPESQRYAGCISFPILVMTHLRNTPSSYIRDFFARMRKFYVKLPKLLADSDLVYCNTLGTLPVACCCKLRGVPTVLHLHETASSVFLQLVGRVLLPRVADRIVCVSEAVARSWQLERHPNTRVIHNGIPDLSYPELPETGESRRYDLCFVGRLTEKKGIGVFLAALDVLGNEPSARLDRPLKVVIAGGVLPGHQQVLQALGEITSSKNLQITYLGEIDDVGEVFLQSRVACVPSLFHDPFPTVVLEAMRAGCSVVASELGGAREALAGAYGELVPPGDVSALVEAIVRQHAAWGPTTVLHNRQVFANQFTFERFRERLLVQDFLTSAQKR
jgi:glycosyltransferase involved in cell wall biosynthesis